MRVRVALLAVLGVMALGLALSSVAPCDGKPADQTYVDAAIDGLVKAGVLTPDQARQIKEDAAAAAQAEAAEAKPPKPKWSDTIKLSGYTQARWLHYPDADGKSNEFLVRRARIKLGAQPTPRSEVELQLDLGEGDVTVKDAWVQYDLTARGDLRVDRKSVV